MQPDSLNVYDENRLWSDFINARYLGKFSLVGSLKYRPAREASRLYDFQMDGDWNPGEQVSELKLSRYNGETITRKVAIREASVVLIGQAQDKTEESVIDPHELAKPLVDGLPFTWNDMLMPYLKWSSVTYLGPVRFMGRPAHRYVLINDDPLAEESRVIVTLDEDFAVLLKSDVLDKDDNVLKRIRVSGFKQFNDEWMFSELVWEHRSSRESVLLKVSDFSLDP